MSEPAFPTGPKNHGYEGANGTGASPGMSLRDYFAAQALAGELAADTDRDDPIWRSDIDFEVLAERCYRMADAMLKARED